MNITSKKIGSASAWIISVSMAMGILYGGFVYANELTSQVQSNTEAVMLMKWQKLNEKRKNQGLSPAEKFEYCKISGMLGFKSEGCA